LGGGKANPDNIRKKRQKESDDKSERGKKTQMCMVQKSCRNEGTCQKGKASRKTEKKIKKATGENPNRPM